MTRADQTPMEALLERIWGNAERKKRDVVIRNIDCDDPAPFIDRFIRKTHPTSPKRRRHDPR